MVAFKNSIFKNKAERFSFMQEFLEELITSKLIDESCKKTKMANADSGCYLSFKHGRLPKLVYIGVYTDENGDYAFLRFWEFENYKYLDKIISKRVSFIKQNESRIKEFLGRDIGYHSKNKRPIGTFKIDGDDSYYKGFVAHGKIRKSREQLLDDLMRMTKVLKLIMENERKLPQRVKQSKEPISADAEKKIIEPPCFRKKIVPHKLFLTKGMPEDSICVKVIIIGPYPTEGFVQRVRNNLNPQSICVVTDSSWKEEEIDKIKKIDNIVVQKVQTSGIGIVHAKMYYVEYSNAEVQLFFGSINASENSNDNNSEFISSFWLHSFSLKNQDEIREYFTNLENGKNAKPLEIKLKSCSTLFFPEILACNDERENSFRNWIRKGYFFIKYDSDPNLGTYPINVKDNKIPKSEMKELLKGTPLEKEDAFQKMIIPYPYAKFNVSRKENKKEHWKENYGVATEMGCWVSCECLKALKGSIPPTRISRNKIVENIKNFENVDSEGSNFYKAIEKKKKLKSVLDLPSKKVFLKRLKDKIDSDKLLIFDDVYCTRYLTGYSRIPATILNEVYLDKIIEDFIDSYMIKYLKGKKGDLVNRLADLKNLSKEEKIGEIEELWKQNKNIFVNYYKKDSKK